jgi:GT2 family glycosyltransferase
MQLRISVAIPVFRARREHLDALLASLEAQTVAPLEVVLSEEPDGGGEPLPVPEQLGGGTPIRRSRNNERLGMVGNWNRAVELTAGEAVVLMGQDDVLHASACEDHAAALEANPAAPASASLPDFIDDGGGACPPDQRSVGIRRLVEPGARYRLPYDALATLALLYGNVTGEPCGTCFRREAWAAVGGYSESFRHAADIDFMLRIARQCGDVLLSAAALSARRIHAGNVTREHISERVTAEDRERLFTEHGIALTEPGLRRRAEARLFTHNLFDALRTRDPRRLPIAPVRPRLAPAIAADIYENLGGRPIGRELIEAHRAG